MNDRINVLITGANGQLGRALQQSRPAETNVTTLTRAQLDIGVESAVNSAVQTYKPDVIINAAAYTTVDKAESEPQEAARINAVGPSNLATALRIAGHGRLIHVSTDFVFDGQASVPYAVDAIINPLGVYGRTKAKGERAVSDELGERGLVVRTAWLYSSHGKNFVLTMLRLMRERGEVCVVTDQIGTPTSVHSLAMMLWRCAVSPQLSGIYHWTDAGVASWYDFAVAIAEEAATLGVLNSAVQVIPIASVDYPTPARRPSYSVLDKTRSYEDLQLTPVHWRAELRKVLRELVNA